jgi:hypothetical protein
MNTQYPRFNNHYFKKLEIKKANIWKTATGKTPIILETTFLLPK